MTNHGARWIHAAIAAQSLLWLINGLLCKVLGFVRRHEAIVGRILGAEHVRLLTTLIGLSEILMAIWIASAIRLRLAVIAQMMLVATPISIPHAATP